MVSSAIFGAAAGTGLALVVGMTIVVYRYYAVKRKGKYWSSLDRWPDPPSTKRPETRQEECSEHCHDASSSHVLNCWRKQQKNYYAVQTRSGNSSIGNAASRIGAVTGMATIRWRSPLSSVANTDSTDSTTSTSSEVQDQVGRDFFKRYSIFRRDKVKEHSREDLTFRLGLFESRYGRYLNSLGVILGKMGIKVE
ncbi:hypothetical protein WN48_10406 [Eufriesea mexicana]|nr:hypothetical protein WN48_10406 [Eufriesea mexicana]